MCKKIIIALAIICFLQFICIIGGISYYNKRAVGTVTGMDKDLSEKYTKATAELELLRNYRTESIAERNRLKEHLRNSTEGVGTSIKLAGDIGEISEDLRDVTGRIRDVTTSNETAIRGLAEIFGVEIEEN